MTDCPSSGPKIPNEMGASILENQGLKTDEVHSLEGKGWATSYFGAWVTISQVPPNSGRNGGISQMDNLNW